MVSVPGSESRGLGLSLGWVICIVFLLARHFTLTHASAFYRQLAVIGKGK